MTAIKDNSFYKKTGRRPRRMETCMCNLIKRKVECFNCHNTRHFARECKFKGSKEGSRQETGRGQDFKPVRTEKEALMTIDEGQINWVEQDSDEGTQSGSHGLYLKAYRDNNLVTKRVEVNLHVNFLEEKPNVQGIGHRWMFDLDYLTDFMNYIPVSLQNQANPAGSKEVIDIDVQTEEAAELMVVSSTSLTEATSKAAVSEKIAKKKPHSPKQSSQTPISKSADDIMIFRKELDALALKHLGPVPATTPTSSNHVNTSNDDEMPEIRIYDKSSEGIFEKASYDDDGIITDFNNLPDEVDVSTNHTLRIHNAHPQSQILGDPNTPVQTRSSLKKITEAHALFKLQQVWVLVDLPNDAKVIGTKWVYRNKKDERGVVVRNKARLVAQGHRQEEGIDYDEVFCAPVSPQGLIKCIAFVLVRDFRKPPKGTISSQSKNFQVHQGKTKARLVVSKRISSRLSCFIRMNHANAAATLIGSSSYWWLAFLESELISWQCKKQTIVATSTTEAEYVAAASCCGQVLWLQNQLLDYGFNFMNTIIHIDNQSTICIIKNPVYHSKTKHIEIRHHFIRDCYEKKLIQVQKIHTDLNVADLLTKPFDGPRYYLEFERMLQAQLGHEKGHASCHLPIGCKLVVNPLSKAISKITLTTRPNLSNVPSPVLIFKRFKYFSPNLSMAQLKYCDKHNQVGFLLKPAESAGYTEIVDFLRRSKLRYALTHNPPIYDSLVKQFWQTATARTLADGTQQINATIDSIEYTITEESVRRQLQLADASGINMLQNEEIFEGLQNIGSKSGGWDQFGSNIATALICLSTGRDFNFSKLIFDGMISNLKSKSKFLMYPRFLQMILNIQTENKNLFVPVLLTKKIFGNMKRSFQGIHRPLLPAMLTIDAGQPQPSAAPTPSQLLSPPTPSHVQIPTPPSTQPPTLTQPEQSTTPPPIQPVQPTSSPPITTIPDTQPTHPPSPQIPSPPHNESEGPSFEPSYHMSPPPSHEPEIQTSRTSEESEQLRNLLDLVPRLESRVEFLEKELSDTKQTLGTAVLKLIKKIKRLEYKLRQKRKREETVDEEDAEGQDQDIPSPTDQGNKFATPEKSKDLGEAQAEQISPSTLEAAQILTNVASEGFKGSQAPHGSKIYRRKPKSYYNNSYKSLVRTEESKGEKEKAPMTEEELQAEVQAIKKSRSKELQEATDKEEEAAKGSTCKLNLTDYIQARLKCMIIFSQKRFNKKKGANILLRIEPKLSNMIQLLPKEYERYKKQDQTFVAIGSEEDERAITKMNEQVADKEKEHKAESVHEEIKEEEGAKKRKLGTRRKLKAKRRKYTFSILDHQYPIVEWKSFYFTTKPQHDPTKPLEDVYLNMVTRSNGHQRFFRTLMGVLSILDREDLKAVYELVMEKYQDEIPEGFDKVLWGDLLIMFNQGDTADFWDEQLDWKIISWKLHSSSGVHTIMTSNGLVIHMLVENRYPLTKEVLSQLLDLKLETEEESTMALELIKFVKQQLEELGDSDNDDLAKSDHEEGERV
ncbi:putative ribonuclease H-like domain-containing protein [Tanacetum coccineum]